MFQACPSLILSSCLLLRLAVGLRRRRIPHELPRACNARANRTVYRHSHGRMRTTGRSLCRPSLQRELATFDDETWASRKLRACTRSQSTTEGVERVPEASERGALPFSFCQCSRCGTGERRLATSGSLGKFVSPLTNDDNEL
uniref:Putative secreted protein n=1 Tax=Ixodes ricinus TaxID=34613 RepID=A0A6B0UTQ7_IXORI